MQIKPELCHKWDKANTSDENITKHYKKAPSNMKAEIDKTSSEIAKKLKVDNTVQKFTVDNTYLTIKDHKPNFIEKKPCRLINPAKNQIGKISKLLLQDIKQQVQMTQPPFTLTLWSNTNEVSYGSETSTTERELNS